MALSDSSLGKRGFQTGYSAQLSICSHLGVLRLTFRGILARCLSEKAVQCCKGCCVLGALDRVLTGSVPPNSDMFPTNVMSCSFEQECQVKSRSSTFVHLPCLHNTTMKGSNLCQEFACRHDNLVQLQSLHCSVDGCMCA